jgi:hypothetical protein
LPARIDEHTASAVEVKPKHLPDEKGAHQLPAHRVDWDSKFRDEDKDVLLAARELPVCVSLVL